MTTDPAVMQAKELIRNHQTKDAVLTLIHRIDELNQQRELREAVLALAQRPAAPVQHWEYCALHVHFRPGSEFQPDYWFLSTRDFVPHRSDPHFVADKEVEEGWESQLNEMGAQGWELVSALPQHTSTAPGVAFEATQTVDFVYHFVLFFKRPKA